MKEKFALRGFLDSITGIEEKSSSTTSESNRDGNGGEDDDFGCKEKIKKIIKKRYRYRVLSAGLELEIRVLAVGKYS